MPERAVRRLDPQRRVDDLQRVEDHGVVVALDPQAHELEEARVDDAALVGLVGARVPDVVGRRPIGIAVLGDAQVVRPRRPRAGARGGPALDVGRPGVRDGFVARRRGDVAPAAREVGGAHQARDLGRDRPGRPAALVLPALLLRPRAAAHDVVGGAADARPRALVGPPELPGEHDRQRDLVELRVRPALLAADLGVLRERAVGLLLAEEEVVDRPVRGRRVARREQRGADLVEVARPHEVVGTGRQVGLDRAEAPAPRHRRRGDAGAPVGLVLAGLEHHQRAVVELAHGRVRDTRRRRLQPRQVLLPAARVGARRGREAARQRASRRPQGRARGAAEAERERHPRARARPGEAGLRRLADVARPAHLRRRPEPVGRAQPVPGVAAARVAARAAPQRGAGGEGARGAVVARHQRAADGAAAVVGTVVAERRVGEDVEAIRAPGQRTEADVDQHGRPRGVGDEGLLEPPAPAPVGDHLPEGEAAPADAPHARAGAARLARDAAPVAHRELEVAQRRRAEVGVVDLAEPAWRSVNHTLLASVADVPKACLSAFSQVGFVPGRRGPAARAAAGAAVSARAAPASAQHPPPPATLPMLPPPIQDDSPRHTLARTLPRSSRAGHHLERQPPRLPARGAGDGLAGREPDVVALQEVSARTAPLWAPRSRRSGSRTRAAAWPAPIPAAAPASRRAPASCSPPARRSRTPGRRSKCRGPRPRSPRAWRCPCRHDPRPQRRQRLGEAADARRDPGGRRRRGAAGRLRRPQHAAPRAPRRHGGLLRARLARAPPRRARGRVGPRRARGRARACATSATPTRSASSTATRGASRAGRSGASPVTAAAGGWTTSSPPSTCVRGGPLPPRLARRRTSPTTPRSRPTSNRSVLDRGRSATPGQDGGRRHGLATALQQVAGEPPARGSGRQHLESLPGLLAGDAVLAPAGELGVVHQRRRSTRLSRGGRIPAGASSPRARPSSKITSMSK